MVMNEACAGHDVPTLVKVLRAGYLKLFLYTEV